MCIYKYDTSIISTGSGQRLPDGVGAWPRTDAGFCGLGIM